MHYTCVVPDHYLFRLIQNYAFTITRTFLDESIFDQVPAALTYKESALITRSKRRNPIMHNI